MLPSCSVTELTEGALHRVTARIENLSDFSRLDDPREEPRDQRGDRVAVEKHLHVVTAGGEVYNNCTDCHRMYVTGDPNAPDPVIPGLGPGGPVAP